MGSSCLIRGGRRRPVPRQGRIGPVPIPGNPDGDLPFQWTPDGRSLYFREGRRPGQDLARSDLTNGQRAPVQGVPVSAPRSVGPERLFNYLITPDGSSYVGPISGFLADLFVLDGRDESEPRRRAPASAPTRSSRRSARAGWARCTGRGTRGSRARWRSRCCRRRWRRIRSGSSVSRRRRGPPRR